MPVTRTQLGRNDDGTPHYLYAFEGVDHIVATGPAAGFVQLADGTSYDVTDHYIEVASAEHAAEVAHHVAVQLERAGTLDADEQPFRHTDCAYCAGA